METVHKKDTTRLKEITTVVGISKVGAKTSEVAWRIVQRPIDDLIL